MIEVFIQGQRLDLYDTESIRLNRAVQDIKDISKIYTDFTQTFTVPASKNNNKIFKHFERPEIDNGYDTRIKKDGHITIASLDFLSGKIRLESIKMEGNMPKDYKITFFGNLVSLKDLVGEDELKDLSWLSQFNHPYEPAQVIQGLSEGISFTVDGSSQKVIRYPLISPERRFVYNSVTASISSDPYVNIFDPGFHWYELKPSISFEWIIRAIEEEYGISFSGDFFKRKEFKDIQLWLCPDKGFMKASGKSIIPFPTNTFISNYKFEGTITESDGDTFPDTYTCTLDITPTTDAKYDIIIEDLGQPYLVLKDVSGAKTVNVFIKGEARSFSYAFYLQSKEALVYDASVQITKIYWQENETNDPAGPENSGYQTTTDTSTVLNQNINTNVDILAQMPEMKVLEFLEGIFKMFNLTIIPKEGKLSINNLEEWYAKGRIIDVSPYINKTNLPIDKGTILGQINLQFKEGESFLLKEFKETYLRSYGDIQYIIRDQYGKRVDGESLSINIPFEQMIYERLTDQNDGALSNVQYGWCVNEDFEPYKIAPHVFYPVIRNQTINVLDKSEVKNAVNSFITPSHIGGVGLGEFSISFNTDYEEFTRDALTDNLLTNYYLDYLTDIFSPKRRVFNFKAKLPNHLIRDIQLNDRLIIDGRRYIINTMNLGLTGEESDLELINDIYRGETVESLTTKILLSSYSAEYQKEAASGSFTYQTNEEVNYVTAVEVVDLGYGNTWIVPTHSGNTISYTVAENTTGADRYTAIKITGFSDSVSYHKIKQYA